MAPSWKTEVTACLSFSIIPSNNCYAKSVHSLRSRSKQLYINSLSLESSRGSNCYHSHFTSAEAETEPHEMTILGEKEKTGETDSNPGDQVQTVSRC